MTSRLLLLSTALGAGLCSVAAGGEVRVADGLTNPVRGLRAELHRQRIHTRGNIPYSVNCEGPGVRKVQSFKKDDIGWYTLRNVGARPLLIPGPGLASFRFLARDAEGRVFECGNMTVRGGLKDAEGTDLDCYVLLLPNQRLTMHASSLSGYRLAPGKKYAVWFELRAEPRQVVRGAPAWSGVLKSNEVTWIGHGPGNNLKPVGKPVGAPGPAPKPAGGRAPVPGPRKPDPKPDPEPGPGPARPAQKPETPRPAPPPVNPEEDF